MTNNTSDTAPSRAHPASISLGFILKEAMKHRRKVFLLGFELRRPLDMPPTDDNLAVEALLKTRDEKFGPVS